MPVLSFRRLASTARKRAHCATTFVSLLVFTLLGLARVSTLPLQAQTNGFPEYKPETVQAYWRTLADVISSQVGTNAQGYFCLARLQSQLGEKGEAERLARKALQTQPGRSEVAMFLADLLIRQDRMQEAAVCLQEALRANPRMKGGQRQLGMVLERLGDRQGAREAFASGRDQIFFFAAKRSTA